VSGLRTLKPKKLKKPKNLKTFSHKTIFFPALGPTVLLNPLINANSGSFVLGHGWMDIEIFNIPGI